MEQDPPDNSARLARVEAQTQVLAEALVALTAQSEAVVKAIDAVKDEMSGSTPVPSAVPCERCQNASVEVLTTLTTSYYHCSSCVHSWEVPSRQAP